MTNRCVLAERVADLETEVQALNTQLQEEEEEATNVVNQWQESCSALDEKCTDLEKELESLAEQKGSLEHSLQTVQKQNEQLQLEKSSVEEKLIDQSKRWSKKEDQLQAKLTEKINELAKTQAVTDVIQQWEGKKMVSNVSRRNSYLTLFLRCTLVSQTVWKTSNQLSGISNNSCTSKSRKQTEQYPNGKKAAPSLRKSVLQWKKSLEATKRSWQTATGRFNSCNRKCKTQRLCLPH